MTIGNIFDLLTKKLFTGKIKITQTIKKTYMKKESKQETRKRMT